MKREIKVNKGKIETIGLGDGLIEGISLSDSEEKSFTKSE